MQLLWKQQAYCLTHNCIPTKNIHLVGNGLYSSGRNVCRMKQLQSPKKCHHGHFNAFFFLNYSSFQGWLSRILCHIIPQLAHADDEKFMTEVWVVREERKRAAGRGCKLLRDKFIPFFISKKRSDKFSVCECTPPCSSSLNFSHFLCPLKMFWVCLWKKWSPWVCVI